MKKQYSKQAVDINNKGLLSSDSEYELTPEAQKELDRFRDNADLLIHSEETRDKILGMLQAGRQDPVKAVANTSLMVFKRLEQSRAPDQFNEVTMVFGALYIVTEVASIGMAAGILPEMSEDDVAQSLKQAMEQYFLEGIQKGTIDPVELQKTVDPLMKMVYPGLYQKGKEIAEKAGLPGA